MFRNPDKLRQKYYPLLEKFFGVNKNPEILEIDFQKPWWDIIWRQKSKYLITLFFETFLYVFLTLIPLIIIRVIDSGQINYLFLFVGLWLILNILPNFYIRIFVRMSSTCVQSVYYSSVRFFLTVDPIFHTTRSSGQIIAKVNRGSDAYIEFLDIFTFEIVTKGISLITALVAVCTLDLSLGLLATACTFFIIMISGIGRYLATSITAREQILQDDKRKELGVESLSANNYIRSSFATPEQNQKVLKTSRKMYGVDATKSMTNITSDVITRCLYILSFLIISWNIFNQINTGKLSTALGLAILLTFYTGSRDIWSVGSTIQKLVDKITQIKDLYTFIRGFGKQTYPVLEE